MSRRIASSAASKGAAARSESRASRLQDIGEDRVVVGVLAPLRQLQGAPLCARLGARRDEDLHRRLGADDRADVAPVEHRPARTRGEAPLRVEQGRPHPRHGGDDRRRLTDRPAAQGPLVEVGETEPARRGNRRRLVVDIAILGDHRRGGRAIEETRVQVRQSVMGREPPGDRAFARSRGTVDGDDHPNAPSRLDD